MIFFVIVVSRSRILSRAASLIATKYRYESLATCMVGQGKTAIQADIDCVAELVDFLRFNVDYGKVKELIIKFVV